MEVIAKENSMQKHISDFMEFIRKQGVVGLAIGFVLGGAVAKVVTALVTDIINPVLSIALGKTENLRSGKFVFGGVDILWGDFLSAILDFLIIALVIYVAIKLIGVEQDEVNKNIKPVIK